jgi:hypothetical protein
MSETVTPVDIPGRIEMNAQAKEIARRMADPQDLNDALLAVHAENQTAILARKIYELSYKDSLPAAS